MRPGARRLSFRDLMIAMVGFAISLKIGLTYSHTSAYLREARFQGRMADAFRFYASRFEDGSARLIMEQPGDRRLAAKRAREFAKGLDHRRSEFLRAALLPWLPSAPAPPRHDSFPIRRAIPLAGPAQGRKITP